MATLGVTLITFASGTLIRASDMNSNLTALNNVTISVAAANVIAGALPAGVTSAGAVIATVGAHSNASTTVEVSVGTGVPASLATNEVYFQVG